MQKQRLERSIRQTEIYLNDEFPIHHFYHTQMDRSLSSLHYHQCFEIGLCLKGSGMFCIENQMISFHEGDVSFIYPNQPHIAQSPNNLPSKWVFIHADFSRLLSSSLTGDLWDNIHSIPYVISSDKSKCFFELLNIIIREMEGSQERYKQTVKYLLNAYICNLLRLCSANARNAPQSSEAFISISPALVHISQSYNKDIELETLAHECGLSATHFRVLFKKALSKSPMQYLAEFRMKMAKSLLRSTSWPIIEIAYNVGYNSISSFNRTFKTSFDYTPTEYRKRNMQDQ